MAPVAIALHSVEGYAQDADPWSQTHALAKAFESSWNSHDMEEPFRKLLTEHVDCHENAVAFGSSPQLK
jgi:hypothetical protein